MVDEERISKTERYLKLKVLYLITARAGSKRVPNKNLIELQGIPLIGFKAIAARRSKYCSRLMISTDSEMIQDNARMFGVEVPFTRPAELATDTASSVDVILHAMSWVEEEGRDDYDALMLLEPAAPFCRSIDYDGAVEMMMRFNASVVVGVRAVPVNSIYVGGLDAKGRLTSVIDKMSRWQELGFPPLPQEYTMNGALYLMKWEHIRRQRAIYCDRMNTYAYLMDPYYSIEIDCPSDLVYASFLLESGYVDISYWK